jgi:hypothetical protein
MNPSTLRSTLVLSGILTLVTTGCELPTVQLVPTATPLLSMAEEMHPQAPDFEGRTPAGSLLDPAGRTAAWRISGFQRCPENCAPFGARGASGTFVLYTDGTGTGSLELFGIVWGSHEIWVIDRWSIGEGSAGPQTLILEEGIRYVPDGWMSVPFPPLDLGIPAEEGQFSAGGGFEPYRFRARVTAFE